MSRTEALRGEREPDTADRRESSRPLVTVDGLNVDIDTSHGSVPVLRDVSFSLQRAEAFGLVGESGSGKSTVLSAMMRMLPNNASVWADELSFDGQDLTSLTAAEMRELRGDTIGLIPQRPMTSLSPVTPLQKQLRWFLPEVDDADIPALLDQVGLRAVAERLDGYPFQFSGGQMQRMLIAIAALARKPELLLADEPTTTLDATVQTQVIRLLLDLQDELELTMVFVSHDLGVIAHVCDRVGVMYGGLLVEVATVHDLFERPQHPYTKALLSALPSRVPPGERLATIPGTASGANRLPGCPFAPRCEFVVDRCRTEVPVEQTIDGSVVRCHRAGENL